MCRSHPQEARGSLPRNLRKSFNCLSSCLISGNRGAAPSAGRCAQHGKSVDVQSLGRGLGTHLVGERKERGGKGERPTIRCEWRPHPHLQIEGGYILCSMESRPCLRATPDLGLWPAEGSFVQLRPQDRGSPQTQGTCLARCGRDPEQFIPNFRS